MSRCLIVLGMHRSGTSALAGALQCLGIDLGSPLMPGQAGENDKGFFEHVAVEKLHESLLAALGHTWHDPRSIPAELLAAERLSSFRDDLRELVSREFGASELWGVKDPRLCRLLPAWMDVLPALGVAPCFVILHRHPEEVAASLERREGFSDEMAALLWADHNLKAELYTRNQPRIFVSYDALLRNPQHTLRKIAKVLGIRWPRPWREARVDVEGLITPALRHHVADRGPATWAPGRLGPIVAELHELLSAQDLTDAAAARERFDALAEGYAQKTGLLDDLLAESPAQSTAGAPPVAEESGLEGREELVALRLERRRELVALRLERRYELAALRAELHDLREELGRLEPEMRSALNAQSDELARQRARISQILFWVSRLSRLYLWLGQMKRRLARSAVRIPSRVAAAASSALPGNAGSARRAPEPTPIPAAAFAAPAGTRPPPVFEHVAEPDVSVVIPVYGHADLTLACLASVAAAANHTSYEVLVVDDASQDSTPTLLAAIPNLRVVRNDTNRGFLHTCNRGATEARGRFLLFLNNDTLVEDGWIDRLVTTFDEFPDAGLVGAKLVFPDGTLQEAGGIIWRDGSGWNFGRGAHPDTPGCNYAREADYCSGACLLITKELFLELGSFDERFAPAYYEDVDLAFRVREAGKKVYYQPTARVCHLEGQSSGTDTSSGVKRHQVVNQERFFEKWKHVLTAHGQPGASPELEKERHVTKRALVIDARMLTPNRDAGSVRMLYMIKLLRRLGYKVTFLPDNLLNPQPYTAELQQVGVEVLHAPFVGSLADHLKADGHLYDVVIVSRHEIGEANIPVVRRHCPRAKVLFDTVDLHFLRERRGAEMHGDAELLAASQQRKESELAVAASADATFVASAAEKELLAREAPRLTVHVVPTIYETSAPRKSFQERRDLFFIGGFEHPPNLDAVTWFTREVFPRVRRRIPGIRLYVIGSNTTPEVFALGSSDIDVLGHVPDVAPFFEDCRLSVAPVRYGAGMKGKVHHSLARGLPCVATTIASEGMALRHGENVMIADDPEAFAEAVERVYRERELWETLSVAGRKHVEQKLSVETARQALAIALEA